MSKIRNQSNTLDNVDMLAHCIELEKYAQVGRLASGLAHNLQSPLTAIKGYAQLIQLDHGRIEELQLIVKEVQLVQQITHNLLCKMRYLQDRSNQSIHINDLIRTELDFLKAHLTFKHKIKKNIDLDAGLPVIKGVPADFSQMIGTIFIHSIHSMIRSPKKEMSIQTRYKSSNLYIEIRDTGFGISEKAMRFIFDASDCVIDDEALNDQDIAVTGIGYAAVQMVIEKYDGKLDIHSTDSGNHVILSVPY